MPESDQSVADHIEGLVAEEHKLLERGGAEGGLKPDEHARLSVPVTPEPGTDECRVVFTVEDTAIPAKVTGGTNPDPRVLGAHFDRFRYTAPG